jgi:multidrug resistance protein, MATE family
MITRERIGTISSLAFPISIALGSNLMMSVIDLAMVGRLGNNAIAAVALASFSNMLVLACVGGVSPAIQGLVARRAGEGSEEPRCLPLNGGLLLVLMLGIPLTILCCWLSPFFFSLISPGTELTRIGVPFLRVLYLGIIASGVNLSFRGYWASIGKPSVYMSIGLFMDCLNILLNYALIFGHFGAPALGAMGAAVSTVLALYTGVVINGAIGYARFKKDGFLSARPGRPLLMRLVQLSVPAATQEFFFSAGYLVFFWMVGQVGTEELAAANVLIRLTMILVVLAMSLGVASATLVAKSAGEGDTAGAAQWGWDTGKVGVAAITLLGIPLFVFPKFFLSIFLSDPHTISMAVIPLRLTAATTGIMSVIYIFAFTLFSVGDGNRVMMVSFSTQWLFFLPMVWFVGPYLHYGLLPIWLVHMAYGGLATALITAVWADGKWKKIKI